MLATPRVRALARAPAAALASTGSVVLLASCGSPSAPSATAEASNGLAYSNAGASRVQDQPSPGSCRTRGSGLYALPDERCTPGALNPQVTQASIVTTICRRGWTATVRPPLSVSAPEKRASMAAYGYRSSTRLYEYDHFVALELGGAVNDPRNLWPERNYTHPRGYDRNPKDTLSGVLRRLVCDGRMELARAQQLVTRDWAAAYREYVSERG